MPDDHLEWSGDRIHFRVACCPRCRGILPAERGTWDDELYLHPDDYPPHHASHGCTETSSADRAAALADRCMVAEGERDRLQQRVNELEAEKADYDHNAEQAETYRLLYARALRVAQDAARLALAALAPEVAP